MYVMSKLIFSWLTFIGWSSNYGRQHTLIKCRYGIVMSLWSGDLYK